MEELRIEPADVVPRLTAFIRQAVEGLRHEGVVVGLSGGIDSAVVAALAARALGAERVLGLILPERDSAPASKRLARQLAQSLSIRYRTVGLTLPLALLGVYGQIPLWLIPGYRLKTKAVLHYYHRLRETLPEGETPFSAVMLGTRGLSGPWLRPTVAYHRVKVRLRMTVLYYYAERYNFLVAGTANKTELATGFFVKYGDAAADIVPLANLYKTQVCALANYLNIPESIIVRPPSPDLLPGLTDELAIGIDYATLDRVLWRLEQGMDAEAIASDIMLSPTRIQYVQTLTERAQRLLTAPLVPPT